MARAAEKMKINAAGLDGTKRRPSTTAWVKGDSSTEGRDLYLSKSSPAVVKSRRSRKNLMICEICTEPRPPHVSFPIKGCSHAYCKYCVAKYVASKLQDNITRIGCPVPRCESGMLEPEYCRSILPRRVFERWGSGLCEAAIPGAHKFYCPFKGCSALILLNNDDDGIPITQAECPYCHRLFCAQCKVPWHSDIDCARFQKLHKNERKGEDIMLMNLAYKKQWKRCPKCRIYVEKTMGCNGMRCRCGTFFCYGCGGTRISSTSHLCQKCGLGDGWISTILTIFALTIFALLFVYAVFYC